MCAMPLFAKGAANPRSRQFAQSNPASEGGGEPPAVRGAQSRPAVEVGDPPPDSSRAAGKRARDDVGVRCAATNCDRVVTDADGSPVPGEDVGHLLLCALYCV